MSFQEWLDEVTKYLRPHNIYYEALACGPYVDLVDMRGDEPVGAFETGESPEEYGDFLLQEWSIYGPEGE